MDKYSDWKNVPEHLKTRTSLKRLGLKLRRGQKPVAVKTHWDNKIPDYDLYDMREAVPNVVSDKQKAALEQAQQKSLEKRTCTNCGWVEELSRDYRGKQYIYGGLCPHCREDARRASDRNEAIEWAREMLPREDVLILDSETTTLYGEIIELAVINLKGETVYSSRFKNVGPIDPKAQAVHGISAEDLMAEPSFADEYNRVKAILEGAALVLIYNAPFDTSCLWHSCKVHGLEPIKVKPNCLMEWYAQYCGEWSSYYKSYKYQPLNGGHSALGDCKAALGVLRDMAELEAVENIQ